MRIKSSEDLRASRVSVFPRRRFPAFMGPQGARVEMSKDVDDWKTRYGPVEQRFWTVGVQTG